MDINTVVQAIAQYGFPIVCCCAMMWYVKYSTDKNREEIARINDLHKEEMSEVTTAINNNTIALHKLVAKLDKTGEIDFQGGE